MTGFQRKHLWSLAFRTYYNNPGHVFTNPEASHPLPPSIENSSLARRETTSPNERVLLSVGKANLKIYSTYTK